MSAATAMLGGFSLSVRLFVVVVVVVVVVAEARDDLRDQVKFSASLTTLQTASCIVQRQGDPSLVAVELHQTVNGSSRLLEKMTSSCQTPPCFKEGLRFGASRASLEEDSTSELTLAWEASASLNIKEDELTCRVLISGQSAQEVPVSVSSKPARKLRWYVNKTSADLTPDSFLGIRLKDAAVNGWRLVGRAAAGVHVNDFMFDPLGTEAGGLALVKRVNSPNISAMTIIHTMSSDPDWECTVREGALKRACGTSAMRNQEAQEAQEIQEAQETQQTQEAQETKEDLLVWKIVAGVSVGIVILFLGVGLALGFVVCRTRKQQDRGCVAGGSARRKDHRGMNLDAPIDVSGPDDSAIEDETALTILINDKGSLYPPAHQT